MNWVIGSVVGGMVGWSVATAIWNFVIQPLLDKWLSIRLDRKMNKLQRKMENL